MGSARDALNGWISAVEARGVLVIQTDRVDTSETRGFFIHADRYPVIAANGSDWPRPKIFTIFHELAHLGLGRGELCDLHDRPPGSEDVEAGCNRIAAATLLPADAVRGVVADLLKPELDERYREAFEVWRERMRESPGVPGTTCSVRGTSGGPTRRRFSMPTGRTRSRPWTSRSTWGSGSSSSRSSSRWRDRHEVLPRQQRFPRRFVRRDILADYPRLMMEGSTAIKGPSCDRDAPYTRSQPSRAEADDRPSNRASNSNTCSSVNQLM